MALREAHRILDYQVEPTHPDYLKIMAIKRDTLAAVLSTQARVDQTTLQGAKTDRRRELIARLKEEQA